MTKKKFIDSFRNFIFCAAKLNDERRRFGLSALEDEIEDLDDEFFKQGLRLAVDEVEPAIIDEILSNIMSHEKNNYMRLYREIQKRAVLGIQEGLSARIFSSVLFSLANLTRKEQNPIEWDLVNDASEESEGDDVNIDVEGEKFIFTGKRQYAMACEDLEYLALKQGVIFSSSKRVIIVTPDCKNKERVIKTITEGGGTNADEAQNENASNEPLNIARECYKTGDCYRELEDYEKAVKYFEDALTNYKIAHGGNHRDIIDTLCYIGICYEGMEDYEKAVKYFIDTAASDEEINGKGNLNITIYYNQISSCYVKLNDLQNALKYCLEALAIREKYLGAEHADTAYVYSKTAEIYFIQEDYNNALVFYDKSYKAYKAANGREDAAANNACFSAAACYEGKKEYEKALSYYKEALDVYKKIHDEDHPDTAVTYFNISACYYYLDDFKKALENDLKALEIRKKICEESAPELSVTYNNAGTDYRSLGKYNEALKYHMKALELRKEFSNEKDQIAFSYNNVGKDYEAKDDKKNALKYYKEALSIYESLEGFESDAENTRQAVKRNEK